MALSTAFLGFVWKKGKNFEEEKRGKKSFTHTSHFHLMEGGEGHPRKEKRKERKGKMRAMNITSLHEKKKRKKKRGKEKNRLSFLPALHHCPQKAKGEKGDRRMPPLAFVIRFTGKKGKFQRKEKKKGGVCLTISEGEGKKSEKEKRGEKGEKDGSISVPCPKKKKEKRGEEGGKRSSYHFFDIS